LVSVSIIVLSHVSRAERWRMLIEPTGVKPRLSTTFGAVLIGYFANLAFPRLGEVSKCGIINRYERIPVDKLIGTMVTERALDLLMLLVLTVAILALEFGRFGDFFSTNIATPLGDKLRENQWAMIMVIAVVVMMIIGLLITYRRLTRLNFFLKIQGFLKGIWVGMRSITQVKNAWLLMFHSLFIWACYFFATWTCFFAMSATEGLGASAALAVLVFGSYGMAAPVQGGLGAFHIMAIASLGAYGLSKEDAEPFAWLIHESQLAVVIILGSLALIVLPFLNHQRRRERSAQAESKDPA
jgi:uncharacterized membrane protein YbhN (UPF0104 family)